MLALYSKNGIWKFLLNVGLEHVFSSQCPRLHLLYSSLYICAYTMMSLFMALRSPNQKTQILYCPSAAPSPTGWRAVLPKFPVNATDLCTSCASPPVSRFILAHQGLSWFTRVTQVRHPAKIKLDPPKLALTTIPPLSSVFSHIEGKQQDEVKICIVLFLHKPSEPCSRGTLVLPERKLFGGNTQQGIYHSIKFQGKMEFNYLWG